MGADRLHKRRATDVGPLDGNAGQHRPNDGFPRKHSWLCVWAMTFCCIVGGSTGASAQGRSPEILIQPGMLSADFVSAPEGFPSTSGFNLRFAALVPTASPWWTLILGASVTPYGTTGVTPRSTNTPVLFAGNVFPLLPSKKTGDWFKIELPLLLTYSYGGGGPRNREIYGKDIVLETALQVNVGRKVLRDLGPLFARLSLYLLFDQNLTPNEDPITERTDRFNPFAYYGVTIPIGGRRDE